MESVLGRIPDVSSHTLAGGGGGGIANNGINGSNGNIAASGGGGSGGGAAAQVMRALRASVSTPSLVAQERARASAREKMTPNLDLDNDDNELLIGGEKVLLSECT